MHYLLLSLCGFFSLVVITNARSVESNTHSNYGLHRLKRHLIKGMHFKRSVLDNRIDPYPQQNLGSSTSDDDETIGEQLMEDFLTFLTLKETGLLDMCLQMK